MGKKKRRQARDTVPVVTLVQSANQMNTPLAHAHAMPTYKTWETWEKPIFLNLVEPVGKTWEFSK